MHLIFDYSLPIIPRAEMEAGSVFFVFPSFLESLQEASSASLSILVYIIRNVL